MNRTRPPASPAALFFSIPRRLKLFFSSNFIQTRQESAVLDAGCIFLLCMQTIALQQKYNSIGGANYESYRHRPPDRRPRPGRHPQGDPPHPPHPRGRPAADDIGTVGTILLRHERFSQTAGVGVVHSNRNYNRAYQRRFYQAEKALELVEIQRVPVPFRITFWDILRLFSLTVFRKYTIINKNICYSV